MKILAVFSALLSTLFLMSPAHGDQVNWPKETIRVIVPYTAGGLTDVVARTFADRASRSLGVPVIVENKPGASTQIGTDYVARSKPDGNTLLVASGPMAVSQYLYEKLPYTVSKDFVPVALMAKNGLVLMANNSGNVPSTLKELVIAAKKNPGAFSVASVGNGTIGHLALERFKSDADVQLQHVPYRGTAAAMPELIGGHIPLMMDNLGTSLQQLHSGKVRALAFTGTTRSPQLPQVPTFIELGYAGMEATNFYGLFAPAGTPREIVRRLNLEATRVFSTVDVRQQFSAAGAEALTSTPEEFSSYLHLQSSKWGAVIRSRGIKAD